MKTAFRKNLDKRYISGEDLFNGVELGKGLQKEMVVTLAKWNDAPAFDQKLNKEVDKTAIWLKEYPSGKLIYKPCLLNVSRSEFLSKELSDNSLFLDDCDKEKPFVLYAKADRRHGYIVAFKKFFAPNPASDKQCLKDLALCVNKAELITVWSCFSNEERKLPTVVAKKESLKNTLK
tara:strand:+ start:276 stop:806 length:531 start_codon:yes stop_codon:yes gene_type:complete